MHPYVILISLSHTVGYYYMIAAMQPMFVNTTYTEILMSTEPVYGIAFDFIFYKKTLTIKTFVSLLILLYGILFLYPVSSENQPGDVFLFLGQTFYCSVSNIMSAFSCFVFKHYISHNDFASKHPTIIYKNVVFLKCIISSVFIALYRLPCENLGIGGSKYTFWEGMTMFHNKMLVILILSSLASEVCIRSKFQILYRFPSTNFIIPIRGLIKLFFNTYILQIGTEIAPEHAYGIGLILIGAGLYAV